MPVQGPHCNGCVQQAVGEHRITTDGLGLARILVVGESPWVDEVRLKKPFAGAAGHFLDRLLHRVGMTRDDILLTNSMWCKPPFLGWFERNKPDAALALNQCRPYLDEVIASFKPRVIVTLGGVAMQRVLGLTGITNHHAYVHDSSYGIPVVPTFHPSFVMQGNQRYSLPMFFVFRTAQAIAKQDDWTRTPTSYILDDPAAMRAYLEQPFETLAVDIETPRSGSLDEDDDEEDESFIIIRASMSHTPATAVTFPWTEPFISMAKDALRRAKTLVMWNQAFDTPRLQAAGCEWTATQIDGMWMWHWLQSDLPKGLGFVAPFYFDGLPWKHLAEGQPAFYSAVDADATMRCYLGIRAHIEEQGRWRQFERHCIQTLPILNQMTKAGVLLDQTAQGMLKTRLTYEYQEAHKQLQEEVPKTVRTYKVWKREPKDLTGVERLESPCPICGGVCESES